MCTCDLSHLMSMLFFSFFFFFFFQAEDGIRDKLVTGVQTCALPIWPPARASAEVLLEITNADARAGGLWGLTEPLPAELGRSRSEERRVGKEGRSGGSAERCKKKRVRCGHRVCGYRIQAIDRHAMNW